MKHSFTEFKRIYTQPMTKEEIIENLGPDSTVIKGTVSVDFNDMFGDDSKPFLDMLSKKLTGSDCLKNISYKVVGVSEGENAFFLEVSGDASEILNKTGTGN